MSDIPRYRALNELRRHLNMSVEQCWAAAFAFGSHTDPLTMGAFLEGTRTLPDVEVDILAAALADQQVAAAYATSDPNTATPNRIEAEGPSSGTSLDGAVLRLMDLFAPRSDSTLSDVQDVVDGFGLPAAAQPIELKNGAVYLRSDVPASRGTSGELSNPAAFIQLAAGSTLRVDAATNTAWEMHGGGDELVVLLSGTAELAIDRIETQLIGLDQPYQAYVLPRGRWHRHYAKHGDAKLLYVTPVHDTRLAPPEP